MKNFLRDLTVLFKGPSTFDWKTYAICPVKRAEAVVIQIDHELFILGGFQEMDHVLNDIDVLDLKTGQWTAHFKMPLEMPQTHVGVVSDSKRYIYCVAGQKGPQCHPAVADCFVLDTKQRTWGRLPSLPEKRYSPTIQLWRGRLHALGGSKEDRFTSATDHWSIAVNDGQAIENEWRRETPPPKGGPHRTSAIIKDKFYVFGGQDGDVKPIEGDSAFRCDWSTPLEIHHGECYLLEFGSNGWQKMADTPVPVTHADCIVINDRFVVIAGGNRGRLELSDDIQMYDAYRNTWRALDRLPYHMKTSIAFYDGWLYLLAGQCSVSDTDHRPQEVQNKVWRTKFLPISEVSKY